MKRTFCDGCGEMITTKPNEVKLHSRRGMDGGMWGTFEVCDKCFNEIREKASFVLKFDPSTVEGALRAISLEAASLDKAKEDEWSPEDYRVRK